MAFVYERDDSKFWWMCWTDANGVEKRESSKTTVEADAKVLADELEAQARTGARRRVLGALTVQRFYEETWLPLQKVVNQWHWKAMKGHMECHFLQKFGTWAIADLATDEGEVALLDWLIAVPGHKSKRDGTPIASRTVRNVVSSVRVFFADATERKVLRRNPTLGWSADRHLPAIEDKKRGWRQQAGFSLEQVVALTTDPRLPEDRRTLYALRFLGGVRPCEGANARWRDLDKESRPLWRLNLESSFNSPMQREKGTKTGASLHIPIHPVVGRFLERWRTAGWAEFMGREPKLSDLIFPREDGKQRLVSSTYKRFKADLVVLGITYQPQYESRSTFRNLALLGGATEFHLNLITHPSPKKASDHYTRLEMQWPRMCEAVLAIDAGAWKGTAGEVPEAEVTSEVTFRVTPAEPPKDKPPTSLKDVGGYMEREKGFENGRRGLTNHATVHAFLSIPPSPQRLPFESRFPILPRLAPRFPQLPGDIRETT